MGKRHNFDDALHTLFATQARDPRSAVLDTVTTPEGLADYLSSERATLIEQILNPVRKVSSNRDEKSTTGATFARDFSDLLDAVLTRMYALACEKAKVRQEMLPLAIVATGGYGRREICPFSDVDITFIPLRDGEPNTERVMRDMFKMVMDVCISRCKLDVGYAYRLMDDCGSLDHQTACGLLDARFIAGSQRLFIQFEDAFWMNFNPAQFIFAKLKEREAMLAKWGQSPLIVEPNLKEGAGGLRDFQTAIWLLQARYNLAAARVRGERAIATLIREGDLSEQEAAQVGAAKEILLQTRNALHALTGEERDHLVVTRQEEVARLLGYENQSEGSSPPVERFMSELYSAMVLLRRVSDQVMRRIGNSRLILGVGLDCKRRQIVPANDALITEDPVWLLWACELAQEHRLELSIDLERTASALVQSLKVLEPSPQSVEIFTRILTRTGSVYPILQKMADLGILGSFLPEFAPLMTLIPYDPSHDYTIGQHTLQVIANLEALLTMQGEEESEMRRVMQELPHPEQLMLAALLHDCGKAIPGRPHADIGAELVVNVCHRLGWNSEATANVAFLVQHHLLMAETSRLRDLNLDETIRDFIRIVDNMERLNMLYLLTYADTRAVGAGVWTQVKGRFLSDLWRKASSVLCEEEPFEFNEASVVRARRRLQKDLSLANLPEEEINEHTQAMPLNYLLAQSLEETALHIGFVRRVRVGEIVIDFHEERTASYTELTVCTYDDPQPGLLAKIAAVLYACDLDVHSAQVLTRITETDRIALDILWVDFKGRPLAPGKQREVANRLQATLAGNQTAQEILTQLMKGRVRRSSQIPRPIRQKSLVVRSVRNDLSDTYTVIETDSPEAGKALYQVSDALSRLGWNIHSARVSFWQGASRANFYVTGARQFTEPDAKERLSIALAES